MSFGEEAARTLESGLGRRGFVRAAAALGVAGVAGAGIAVPGQASAETGAPAVLQPKQGRVRGVYVTSTPGTVRWGHLPNRTAKPVSTVASGGVVTIDTVSHEGILEDQGRDPVGYFGDHGVDRDDVLRDAIAIAASGIEHDFAADGPHVVTGPVAVTGAKPGDVLKIEVLDLRRRVPYGVISSRHGKGALPGEYPEAFKGDPHSEPFLNPGGNMSVFTRVSRGQGVLPAGRSEVRFPLNPFMGLMGVAVDTSERVHSVPPTVAGGNLDVNELGAGSILYLPVQVPGALFYAGDPHFAQGDGEVALTALEASLRGTFRLTVVKKGGPAPEVAFSYPFGETSDYWIPIGLSDPDGPVSGQQTSLDLAMKTAVRNALDFLSQEHSMAPAVAYAYLSAAVDFEVSQVVDRTTGIHALIRKADFH
ncbi:acetamidase [Microtetraspora sp. NBRC 13810]|uniref:acetamidase/formamidase family protein n=1 Tax=Microtetraspora sp. NBRC 13810 TaxID=3030990 RepID=UPI0024A0D2E5|nr:acetamidase/formamidase family protein [Microtetraspora sp. NBRC 13810]GLW10638.1 acetamidase [Microtetraspora sp. NBRC 13810]